MREIASGRIKGGDGLQKGDLVVAGGGVAGACDLEVEDAAMAEAGGVEEGVVDRLLPGGAAGDGLDRGDGVHQLGDAGDLDPVGVLQK